MCVSQEILAHTNRGRQRVPRQSEAEETAGWCRWQMGWRGWLLYFKDAILYLFLPACRLPLLSVSPCCSGGTIFHLVQYSWEDGCMFAAHTVTGEGTHKTFLLFSICTNTIRGTGLQPLIVALNSHGWVTSSSSVKSLSPTYDII